MNIKFDSNQPYQCESTGAVLGLFGGQPLSSRAFEFAVVAGTLLNWRRVSKTIWEATTVHFRKQPWSVSNFSKERGAPCVRATRK